MAPSDNMPNVRFSIKQVDVRVSQGATAETERTPQCVVLAEAPYSART